MKKPKLGTFDRDEVDLETNRSVVKKEARACSLPSTDKFFKTHITSEPKIKVHFLGLKKVRINEKNLFNFKKKIFLNKCKLLGANGKSCFSLAQTTLEFSLQPIKISFRPKTGHERTRVKPLVTRLIFLSMYDSNIQFLTWMPVKYAVTVKAA